MKSTPAAAQTRTARRARPRPCTRGAAARAPVTDRAALREHLAELTVLGTWSPVAEFVDLARTGLGLDVPRGRGTGGHLLVPREGVPDDVRAAWMGEHVHGLEGDGGAAEAEVCARLASAGVQADTSAVGRLHPRGCLGCTLVQVHRVDRDLRLRAASARGLDPAALDGLRLDLRRVELPGEPLDDATVPTWRAVREVVLAELDALGLTATVHATTRSVPLGEHPVDTAGLVRLHPVDADPWPWDEPQPWDDSTTRLAEHLGYRPAPGLPTSLREFCGQATGGGHRVEPDGTIVRPWWLDRPRAWIGPDGLPRLTAECYLRADGIDGLADLITDVHRDTRGEGLPLLLDRPPAPGVRDLAAVLLVFRWDPAVPVLPATWRPMVHDPIHFAMTGAPMRHAFPGEV
jgi:hypothetical protein